MVILEASTGGISSAPLLALGTSDDHPAENPRVAEGPKDFDEVSFQFLSTGNESTCSACFETYLINVS